VSTLWTPDGEHPVSRDSPASSAPAPAPDAGAGSEDLPSFDELSPEDQERARQMAAEMAEAQRQLAEAPVEIVVANHAMGIYELAAIHLSQEPPNLEAAKIAIDAFSGIMDAVESRLGEARATLTQARSQIQMAFVQLSQQQAGDQA